MLFKDMDITTYQERKTAGLIEITKATSGYSFKHKRFDVETGAETDPVYESIDVDQLTADRDTAARKASVLNDIITEIGTL